MSAGAITAIVAVVTVLVFASLRRVQSQQAYVVQLLGRYRRTLEPGTHLLIPFIESVRAKVDMRDQVVSFPPQPAITSDDLVACISTVLQDRVVDPVRATYEIGNLRQALEMSTITALRRLAGSMDMERVRASSHEINLYLAGMVSENAGAWGVKVIQTEIEAIETGSRHGCA
jgi:regulator of protease activity HflC (stomatin/prohibitin superfamily)